MSSKLAKTKKLYSIYIKQLTHDTTFDIMINLTYTSIIQLGIE
jgi:hypothetical protein